MKKYTFEFDEKQVALLDFLINNGMKSGKDATIDLTDANGNTTKLLLGKECNKLDDSVQEQLAPQLPKPPQEKEEKKNIVKKK